MRWPVRYQILLPMVWIVLLTVAVVSALNAWLASGRVKRELEEQLADVSATLTASSFPLEANVLKQMRGLTGAEYVAVDEGGRAVAASDEALISAAEKREHVSANLDLTAVETIEGRNFFHVALPIDRRAAGRGRLVLHVFHSEAAWQAERWQAIWPSLAIGGVSILLVAAVVSLLARQVTRPIHELQQQVGQIAQGDFRAIAIPERNDEVKDLAMAVNQMAERLVQYEEQIRSSERLRTLGTLGGGIAHQIRNAATGARIALDLHRRECPLGTNNSDGGEAMDVAVRQLTQIETSIKRFLALGKPTMEVRRDTDLGQVVGEAVDLMRPLAKHMQVELQVDLPSSKATMAADAQLITQLVVNLAMNAVEAAVQPQLATNIQSDLPLNGKGPRVEVRLAKREEAKWELAVGNTGPGPAAVMQPRLFEPFATDKPGGTGLGLAVARQIAVEHGGSIAWERREEMTWFLVQLPASGNNDS